MIFSIFRNYVIEETVESFNQQQKNGSSDHNSKSFSKSMNEPQETNGKNMPINKSIKETAPTPPLQFVELVVALYAFKCENDEELSFEKGEQLEVIDKPACDPGKFHNILFIIIISYLCDHSLSHPYNNHRLVDGKE